MAREIVQLSDHQRELLTRYYKFYKSLATGEQKPVTDPQRKFLDVCRGELRPTTEHEIAWTTFVRIVANSSMREQQVVEDGFRLEVVIKPPTAEASEERSSESVRPTPEVNLSEFSEYGEGIPAPGWFTDEGWRRMRGGYRFDSR